MNTRSSLRGPTILSFGMADYWASHYTERPWYDERRWRRGRGSMPPHLADRPHIGGPDRKPPHVGTPDPCLAPGGGVKLRDRIGVTPKVRAPHPIAEPIRRGPHGGVRPDPRRALGGSVGRQRPHHIERRRATDSA